MFKKDISRPSSSWVPGVARKPVHQTVEPQHQKGSITKRLLDYPMFFSGMKLRISSLTYPKPSVHNAVDCQLARVAPGVELSLNSHSVVKDGPNLLDFFLGHLQAQEMHLKAGALLLWLSNSKASGCSCVREGFERIQEQKRRTECQDNNL